MLYDFQLENISSCTKFNTNILNTQNRLFYDRNLRTNRNNPNVFSVKINSGLKDKYVPDVRILNCFKIKIKIVVKFSDVQFLV